MALVGCATADEFTWHNSGWANWFEDPLAAWRNGEAFQLIHQEDLPDPDWGHYQPPEPLQ